jgi:hypothetical protein
MNAMRRPRKIGPWDDGDPGSTPVSGSYTYARVNLGVFDGIAGTLSSWGTFSGELARIDTEGQTETATRKGQFSLFTKI